MSDPNRLGNGNNGDSENNRASSFEINWDDILKRAREFDALRSRGNGDLLDDASDNNVEPLKSSKVNTGDDFEEVDLSSAGNKTTSYSERLSALLGYDNTGIDDSERVHVGEQPDNPNNSKDTGKDDSEGVAVGEQPDNPNDSKDTGKDDSEDDEDNDGDKSPESVSNKGNIVRNIMDRFKKSGIGKLFVKGCLVAALVGTVGAATYHSGYKNGTANATAKIESQVKAETNANQGDGTGSDAATDTLNETAKATESNAEVDTEKTDKSVDVVTADGRVIEGVNFELGGDNSGADMIDRSLMESSHFGALTTKPAEWLNGGEGAEYRAAEGNADAMDSLLKKSLEEFNSHAGDPAVLVQEAYSLGYVDKAQMSLEQKGADTMAIMKDNAKYNDMKSFVEQKKIDLEKNMGHGLMLLTDGQHYVSPYIRAVDAQGNLAKSVSEIDSVSHHVDKSANPYEGGVLVITDVVQGTNLNYYEANPEAKEMGLRDIGLIAPDASEAQIKEAMKKYILLGHEAGCKQLIAVEVTPKDTSTYKVEYKTPEKSSSTSTSISITPELPGNPDPKLDDGSGIYKEEGDGSGTHKDEDDSSKKIIRRIYRGGNHHDDSSGIHESDKKKDDETPGKTPDKPSETPDKPNETPDKPNETPDKPNETPDKPNETPKDNEKVLEAKTDNVVGGNEFNSQKEGTATDQNAAPLAGEATNNATMESSGDQLSNREVATQSVIGEFNENNASVSKEEAENKSISTSVTNENPATNSSEAPADSFERQTVADEVVNESNGETAAQSSYDTSAAEANYDFYSAF